MKKGARVKGRWRNGEREDVCPGLNGGDRAQKRWGRRFRCSWWCDLHERGWNVCSCALVHMKMTWVGAGGPPVGNRPHGSA